MSAEHGKHRTPRCGCGHLRAALRHLSLATVRCAAIARRGKGAKHYHFDWSIVPDDGPRFENLVASHLLKWVHFQFDTAGRELDLRYFRDVDGREVDFVVIERRQPILMVEAELTAGPVSPALRDLKERFPACDAYQVHLRGERESVTAEQIHLWTAARFLATLV